MAQVRVTRQFKENFDLWAEEAVSSGDWTQDQMDGLKEIMRKHELADGPDTMRDTLVNYTPEGVELPAAINDPKDRFDYWDKFFASKAAEIRSRQAMSAGIALRIKQQPRKAA